MQWQWMESWRRSTVQLLELLGGGPIGSVAFAMTLAIGSLTLLVLLNVFGRVCGIANRGIIRRLLGGGVGAGAALATTAAGIVWVIPHAGPPAVRMALMIVLPVAGLALVGVPLTRPVFRAAYSNILITLVASLALAVVAMLLTTALFESVVTGDRQSRALKHRADAMENVLNP